MTKNQKENDEWEKIKTREIVDEFLSILQEWFHPDKNWDRIEKITNEFLFERIIRGLESAKSQERAEALEKKLDIYTNAIG